MAKGKRLFIKLVSTAKTGFFYISEKNKNNTKHKLLLKKYDPVIRKVVEFKESKMK